MKIYFSRIALGCIVLSGGLLVAACGSGNSTTSTPTIALVTDTDVPVSATQDSQAAFDFVASVVAKGEADTETPLSLGDAVLAVSDIAEPAFFAA